MLAAEDARYAGLPGQIRQHLAAINGWELDVTDAYLTWSYAVQALRSEYEWTSDWSLVARNYGVGEGVLETEAVCTRCYLAQPVRLIDEAGVCTSCE